MPDTTQLVLAVFVTEAAADGAAGAMRGWARQNTRVELEAIGVLVKDAEGNVKTSKLGPTEATKGMGIGAVLGIVGGIASGGGALLHRSLGLSDGDVARIGSRLDTGHAAVGCLVPPTEAPAIADELEALGGEAETHAVVEVATAAF